MCHKLSNTYVNFYLLILVHFISLYLFMNLLFQHFWSFIIFQRERHDMKYKTELSELASYMLEVDLF